MGGGKHPAAVAMAMGIAAFMLLPIGDAFVKSMAGQWPATAIATLRYVFGLAAISLMLWHSEGRSGFALPLPWLQLGRGLAMTLTITCFFAGVQLMPMVDMSAISFTGPIIVALLSPLIFKERFNRAALIAIAIAFPGMLLILKPNFADIGWAALLPFFSAVGFAFTVIFNRMAAGAGSAMQMQFAVVIVSLPMVGALTLAGALSGYPALAVPMPDWVMVAKCAVVAVTGTLSHWFLFKATEQLSAATVAPLTYSQLFMALVLGAAVFGDWPDATALLGCALIVAAGLYLWRKGRG
jgi:drug/metabolite transporter (DMT)-like permease